MTNLLNPKPRFGFNPTSNLMYDYVAQRDVPLTETYPAKDGVWDLNEVKRLILAGETVEAARRDYSAGETGAAPAPKAVPQADLKVAPSAPFPAARLPGTAGIQALSPAQVEALKLSAIQAAALGITPTMMLSTGVSEAQVRNWALTDKRADALRLTAEQRAVLLPGG